MFDNLSPQPASAGTAPTPQAPTPPSAAGISAAEAAVPAAPQRPAGEAVDIFAGTDASQEQKPPQLQPKVPGLPETANPAQTEHASRGRLYFLLGMAVIGALSLVLIGLIVLAYYNAGAETPPEQTEPAAEQPAPSTQETPPLTEETGQLPEPSAEQLPSGDTSSADQAGSADTGVLQEVRDADGDGLTDTEETTLGTNTQMTDTDGDGLFDREEVRVYRTDPLKFDTDGDTFGDGQEVQSGYSPLGPGKLFQLPQ